MVKKSFAICCSALIGILISVSALAEVSTPQGYDIPVDVVSTTFSRIQNSNVSNTYNSPSILDLSVTTGGSLLGNIKNSFSDFVIDRFFNVVSYQRSAYAVATYTFDPSYNDLYILVPTVAIRNSSTSTSIVYADASSSSIGSSVVSTGNIDWSPIYDGGPQVSFRYTIFRVRSNVFDVSYVYLYKDAEWDTSLYSVSLPIITPLAFTTQSSAEHFVRDKLSSIETGLFTPTPEQSEDVSNIQSAVNDVSDRVQSALDEMSVPDLSYTPPIVSIDGEAVSEGLSLMSRIPWLTAIFGTAVACWVTHLLLYGVRK